MLRLSHKRSTPKQSVPALLFAALGDKMRLALVSKLVSGHPASIAQLTAGSRVTRQAITKHLRVLQRAGIVRGLRTGREHRFTLDPNSIEEMQHYLDRVSRQWDEALARLKSFVET